MFRKISGLVLSISMVFAGFVSIALPAQAAQESYAPRQLYENRDITAGVAFTPDAEDFSVDVSGTVAFSTAQYQALGSGKVLKVSATIKQGTDVVAQEVSATFSGAVSSSYGTNSIVTDGNAASLTVRFYVGSRILAGNSYQVDYQITLDGTALTPGTDFSLNSLTGDFYRRELSTTVSGSENFVRATGSVCLSDSAYSTLSAGDIIEFSVSDASGNSYSSSIEWQDKNYNSDFNNSHTLTSLDLSDGILGYFTLTGTVSAATTFAPELSIKKQGTSTELSALCSETPASAPTLAASATGIEVSQTLPAGVSQMTCSLADARYPLVAIASQSAYANSGSATCSFFGLKQGDYVGWTSFGTYVFPNNMGTTYSFKSPTSSAVTYSGGNSTFREFTGTSGGSGQGSLALTDITYNGYDFATTSRSSDGQGGLLVASLEGADDKLSLRRLTPSGMDSSFGGSGTATLDLQPYNYRSRNSGFYRLGWYGTSRDKFVVTLETGNYGGPGSDDGAYNANEDLQVILGDYASGATATYAISRAQSTSYCKSVVTGAGNNSYSGSINGILSAPSANPLFVMYCNIDRNDSGSYYSSSFMSVAELDGNGNLVLKYKLGAEPNASAPCVSSSVSLANSAATGSQPLVAAYQVTWLPSSGNCYSYGPQGITSADVVSRDLYVFNADTATTTVTPVANVLTVTGSNEPQVCGYGGYCLGRTNVILSGPNVFLLAGTETSGQQASTISYRVGVLSNSSFGTLEQLPNLTVNGTTEFGDGTIFQQIQDYSESDATSVLLLRSDYSTGTTASRVSMSDGATTSYQQIATSGSGMQMFDGFSTAVGNASGDLNFYGIESRTSAVLGQWVTTGSYDPALTALPINQGAANTGVSNPNQMGPSQPQSSSGPASSYTGPVLKAPGTEKTFPAGRKVKFSGEGLESVSKVEIDGKELELEVNSDGEIEVVIPRDLAPGTYDLVITSDSGRLTVQDAIKVGSASSASDLVRPSAKKNEVSNHVKVRVFDVVGAGKVQIFVNGAEIVWINTEDYNDSKLFDDYLVRTVNLEPGKNVIEVYVGGERAQRWAYSG